MRYPLTDTIPAQRSGHSTAMMSAVRAPQSKPPTIALSIFSASSSAIASAGDDRRLTVTKRVGGQEARRSVAAQVRHDHPVAGRCQQRRHVDVAVNVVRPAVQKEDRRTARRARLRVPHAQEARIDLFQWTGTRHSGGSVRAADPSLCGTAQRQEPLRSCGGSGGVDRRSSRPSHSPIGM